MSERGEVDTRELVEEFKESPDPATRRLGETMEEVLVSGDFARAELVARPKVPGEHRIFMAGRFLILGRGRSITSLFYAPEDQRKEFWKAKMVEAQAQIPFNPRNYPATRTLSLQILAEARRQKMKTVAAMLIESVAPGQLVASLDFPWKYLLFDCVTEATKKYTDPVEEARQRESAALVAAMYLIKNVPMEPQR